MSDENAEDDELYEVRMVAAVVAVTVRDHVPGWRNVIGWKTSASWVFCNMRMISPETNLKLFSALFLLCFTCTRVWIKTEIKPVCFSSISVSFHTYM